MRSQDAVVIVVNFQYGVTRQGRHDGQSMSKPKYFLDLSNLHVIFMFSVIECKSSGLAATLLSTSIN